MDDTRAASRRHAGRHARDAISSPGATVGFRSGRLVTPAPGPLRLPGPRLPRPVDLGHGVGPPRLDAAIVPPRPSLPCRDPAPRESGRVSDRRAIAFRPEPDGAGLLAALELWAAGRPPTISRLLSAPRRTG